MKFTHLILASGILVTSTSFAETPVTRFDNMVVSATKMPETNFDMAGSASTIDQVDLKRKQPERLHDLFKDMPSVEAGSGPRRTAEQINIRGFGQQRTVVRVDGGRQNFDFGHNGRIFIDPEFLRQVDVLRGAHSTTHGSGALGGVVSMNTIEAADYLRDDQNYGAMGKASYGTNNKDRMGKAAIYGRYDDTIDGIVSVIGRKNDDVKPARDPKIDLSRDRIKSGLAKVNLHIAEHHHIAASLVHFNDDHPILSTPNLDKSDALNRRVLPFALALNSNYPVDRDTRQTMGSLAYHVAPDCYQWLDFTMRYYGSATHINDSIRTDFSTALVRDDKTHLNTRGFDLYNVSHVPLWCDKISMDWLYGVESYQDKQEGTRNQVARLPFPKAQMEATGFYTKLDLHVPYVTFSPGYRYDRFETKKKDSANPLTRHFHKGSPSFATKVKPVEWLMVYGSYAQAFRAPSLAELYGTGLHFPGRRNNVFIANPDLEPELAKTYETGVGFTFNDVAMKCDHLRMKFGYFKTHADDFIERIVNPRQFTTTIANLSSVRIRGFEGELAYETPTIFAGAGFSALKGINRTTNSRLASVPPYKASALLGSKIPDYGVELGWRAVMNRKQSHIPTTQTERTPTLPTPGYSTHDLFLNWTPTQDWGKHVEFNIGVDNVTDKHYRKHLSNLPEMGRNVKFGLTTKL